MQSSPGTVTKVYSYPGYCAVDSLTGITEFPGKGLLQNFQKFRVRVWTSFRTSRSSGYCGKGVQNSQKFRAGAKLAVPVPPGVVATGVQNIQKFPVQV